MTRNTNDLPLPLAELRRGSDLMSQHPAILPGPPPQAVPDITYPVARQRAIAYATTGSEAFQAGMKDMLRLTAMCGRADLCDTFCDGISRMSSMNTAEREAYIATFVNDCYIATA